MSKSYTVIKAGADFLLAVVLLILLAPLLLLIAVVVRLDSRGPAIYTQRRTGANGREFTIYKFRTMELDTPYLSTEEMGKSDRSHYTRVGPFLRRTSIDELPQLVNILKGEMSFIGPRPPLVTQHDVNRLRLEKGAFFARPGITGLAQVMGRDDLDVESKVGYDAEYCHNIGLRMDLRILWLTVLAVVLARGNK